MMDYCHDLRFGSFITPAASPAQTPVVLAQVSEAAGLDLATFQDHPYQPAFLDTWTLMSYVAAVTELVERERGARGTEVAAPRSRFARAPMA